MQRGRGTGGGTLGQASTQGGSVESRGSNARGAQGTTRRSEMPGDRDSNARGAQGPDRGRATAQERGRIEEGGRTGANDRGRLDERSREETTGRANTRTDVDTGVNLSSEQRTRVHDMVFSRRDIPRVSNLDVDLRVNSVIPRSVRLAPVPEDVVRIYPQFRRHRIFIDHDEIVIVDPVTLRIVAVLPA